MSKAIYAVLLVLLVTARAGPLCDPQDQSSCGERGNCLPAGYCQCEVGAVGPRCQTEAQHDVELEPNRVRLVWSIDEATDTAHFRLEAHGIDGYVALMLGSNDMEDGDVWVGSLHEYPDGSLHPTEYMDRFSFQKGRPGLDVELGGQESLRDVQGWELDDGFVLTFSRSLSVDDEFDRAIERGSMPFGYAYHPTEPVDIDDLSFRKHTKAHGAFMNFFTGDYSVEDRVLKRNDWIAAHGILMTVAFAGFFGVGALCAIRAKRATDWQTTGYFKKVDAGMFERHRMLQFLGVVVTLAAFIIGLVHGSGNLAKYDETYMRAHAIIGVIAFTFIILQVIAAAAFQSPASRTFHRVVGRGLFLVFLYQLVSGSLALFTDTMSIVWIVVWPSLWVLVVMYENCHPAQVVGREEGLLSDESVSTKTDDMEYGGAGNKSSGALKDFAGDVGLDRSGVDSSPSETLN